MRAEILSVGTELLLGEIVDTNAAWLAQQLATAGVDVYFRTTVGDNVGRIAEAVRLALGRADVVITTGGLGPTVDDVTREGVAQAVGRELILDETLLEQVRRRFDKWGSRMSENNVRQAYLPRGAQPVENPVGTAPAFIFEQDGHYVFTLPGVPREMKFLTETRVLPWLRERTGGEHIILSRILRTVAVGESLVDAKIADLETSRNPTVGLAAHPGQTDVRITAKAATRPEAERMIREMETRLRERLGDAIYGVDRETVEEVAARLLLARGWRLVIAESNTQGKIAQRLEATPAGAGVLKDRVLLEGDTPIDTGAAEALALELKRTAGVEVALAVLSTRGPGQDLYGESTGESAIAVVTPERTLSRAYSIGGDGELAQGWVLMRALDLVRRVLL